MPTSIPSGSADILMAMEERDSLPKPAAALLASPSPLADVYMSCRPGNFLHGCGAGQHRAKCRGGVPDAQRELPLYRHDAAYAREQGDLDLYRVSRRANIACKEAIEASISEHYRDGVPAGQRRGAPGDRAVRLHPHSMCWQTPYSRRNGMGRLSPPTRHGAKTVDIPPNPDGFGGDRQPGLRGGQSPRPGRSVFETGAAGLSASPTADAGGDSRRGRPAVARACAPDTPNSPHGTHYILVFRRIFWPAPAPRPTTS